APGEVAYEPGGRSLADMHINAGAAQEKFREGKFRIARKSPEQILAMRSLVCARGPNPFGLPGKYPASWIPEMNGGLGGGGMSFFIPGAEEKMFWLRYRHLSSRTKDGDLNPRPELITDFSGYNSFEPRLVPRGENWVGDLILECRFGWNYSPQGAVL